MFKAPTPSPDIERVCGRRPGVSYALLNCPPGGGSGCARLASFKLGLRGWEPSFVGLEVVS